jgi:hypothetical protein
MMGIVTGGLYLLILFGLTYVLIKKGWSTLVISYLVAALCSFIGVITENQIFSGIIRFPEDGSFFTQWITQTFISGTGYFLILLFFRNVFFKFPLMDTLSKPKEPKEEK